MKRGECLDQAKEIIQHDRNSEYGEPEDNFGDIGSYWTTFLRKKLKTDARITPADVAVMSALIKVSRLQNTPGHEDSYVDIAGYAACGVECATETKESESFPALMMICGCPVSINNLVERGNNLYCANCGHHYPRPEIKDQEEKRLPLVPTTEIPEGFVLHNNRLVPEAEMEGVEGYDRRALRPGVKLEQW